MPNWIALFLVWVGLATSALAENRALATSAPAENRIALVIGNDRYDDLSEPEQLHNAVNDARAMKKALEGLNFQVDIGENLDRNQFIDKVSDFSARLQPGDIAFFFYAGHGVSFSGANYLLPRDVPSPRSNGRDEENRLADHAIAETRIVERIRPADTGVAVIVLDACRDNPLVPPGGRSLGQSRGLEPPPQTRGVLTLYSAGAGEKATDIGEGDSLFTGVLVKELATPGLGLRELAFNTQSEVARLAASHGLVQEPAVYSQIIGDDVYLAGPPKSAVPYDETLAAMIDAATSADWLTPLIAGLPEGPLKERAKARAEALKKAQAPAATPEPPKPSPSQVVVSDEAVMAQIDEARSADALELLIARLPEGPLTERAKAKAEALKKTQVATLPPKPTPTSPSDEKPTDSSAFEQTWVSLKTSKDTKALKAFLDSLPADSRLRGEVEARIEATQQPTPLPPSADEIAWNTLKTSFDRAALIDFVANYPSSRFRPLAEARLASLPTPPPPIPSVPPPSADEIVWNALKTGLDRAALRNFVANYPSSRFRPLAEARLASLPTPPKPPPPLPSADEIAWSALKTSFDRAALRNFVAAYPTSRFRPAAESRLAALVPPPVPAPHPPKPAATQGKCFQFAGERYCK